jgi:uncharacterized sporulation protein YeaH/YhbH (DUF444 family)
MSTSETTGRLPAINGWYDLFSRGSRDWLRHSEKVREAVREHLPQIIASGDMINHGTRTVRVPMRVLEHYQFRLRAKQESAGVGQGKAKPGDVLGQPRGQPGDSAPGQGGTERGSIELMLEFKVDDIIDWLWEDLQLPNLQVRTGASEQTDWMREGLDKRGARSRLDRRRSLKEAIKRRAHAPPSPTGAGPPGFTDEDLRFRQLTRRRQPAIRAVVFFLMDVSGSMSDNDRQLAKTFFFWVAAGLRREYRQLDTVFVAHTTEAHEFSEPEFFQVTGNGGTVASTGFAKVQEVMAARFNPASTNVYLFYASDGDNASDDQQAAHHALAAIASVANYAGYLEIRAAGSSGGQTATAGLFIEQANAGLPCGSYAVSSTEDIWAAVRHFFSTEAKAAAGDQTTRAAP